MKKQLLTGALALGISFGAVADWSLNKNGVPVVNERTMPEKVMALFDVCTKKYPTIALGDLNIPDEAIGNTITFKVRIDEGDIYSPSAGFTQLSDEMNGLLINMEGAVFRDLLNGETIRYQFKNRSGDLFVESYSLAGITDSYAAALALCGDEYFKDEKPAKTEKKKDLQYF